MEKDWNKLKLEMALAVYLDQRSFISCFDALI
jgi:hypothetical protein